MWERIARDVLREVTRHAGRGPARPPDRSPEPRTPSGKVRIEIIDGDSFVLDGETIRLQGIDAPEIGGARCLAEKLLGRQAKQYLQSRLLPGARIDVERLDTDKYGRTLARVRVDGRDLADDLVDQGLAMPYNGRKTDWCGG